MKTPVGSSELLENLSSTRSLRDTFREVTRRTLERFPHLYISIARRRNTSRRLIDNDINLVIEGFPRSGNTYLLSSLIVANPGLNVASHLHSIAHIRVAQKRDVPVVITIREPKAAIASEIINQLGRNQLESPAKLTKRYERFYTFCLSQSEHLVISPFETTTSYPERVIQALNDRLDLELRSEGIREQDDVLADVERLNTLHVGHPNELTVARPSTARAELADRIKDHLTQNHASSLARLQDLHDALAASPTAVRPTTAQ